MHILCTKNIHILCTKTYTSYAQTQTNTNYTYYRTGKIGGADKLTPQQSNSLERQQIMEFKKRYKPKVTVGSGLNRLPGNYAGRTSDNRAELVLCVDGRGECIGCAGVEGE